MQTYSQQLQLLHENLQRKHPTLINMRNVLLYDNAKPHSARILLKKTLDLDWPVLPHPPSSSPSDFHLFHSLQNALNEKKNFLRRSGENIYEKFLELETS